MPRNIDNTARLIQFSNWLTAELTPPQTSTAFGERCGSQIKTSTPINLPDLRYPPIECLFLTREELTLNSSLRGISIGGMQGYSYNGDV